MKTTTPIDTAAQSLQANKLDLARRQLSAILRECPDNPEANYYQGIIELRENNLDRAQKYFLNTLEELPENIGALNNLGTAYWKQAKHLQAIDCFQKLTVISPKLVDAWSNLGRCWSSINEYTKAQQCFEHALLLDPKRGDVSNAFALFLHERGENERAVYTLKQSLDLVPDYAASYGNLGAIHITEMRYYDAISAYHRALAIAPETSDFYLGLGTCYFHLKDFDTAQQHFFRAREINPLDPNIYINLGSLFTRNEDYEQAITAFEQAIKLGSAEDVIHINLGTVYFHLENYDLSRQHLLKALRSGSKKIAAINNQLGRIASKEEDYESALKYFNNVVADSNRAETRSLAYSNRGLVKATQGKWQDAQVDFETAIKECPDNANAHYIFGAMDLKLGRYSTGWKRYEWRFVASRAFPYSKLGWNWPEWQGQNLENKTILVHHEQGLGDAIQFVRYIPLLKQQGARIKLRCGAPLARLFKESYPELETILSRDDSDNVERFNYDFQIPIMSLPLRFKTELDSIPFPASYLKAPPSIVSKWKKRVDKNKFNVGLVWAGNADQGDDRHRSCPLEAFGILGEVENVKFLNLQVGPPSEQIKQPSNSLAIEDYTADFSDMAETAGLVMNLDLVITVDTSVAHLSGALGVPVWVLLWTNCCWRYLLDRTDSPWYESMRLFRQQVKGEWEAPIKAIKKNLDAEIRKRRL